jgi:nucleotide-binding universal stress UspA family protein
VDINRTAPGMKHILLCTDGSAFSKVCYEYTAWFAKRLQAQVEILYVSDRTQAIAPNKRDLTGSIGIGAYTELLDRFIENEHESAKLEHERSKFILREAKEFLHNDGLDDTLTIHRTGMLADSFHEFETECDLIVLGKRGEASEFASDHLGSNMEQVVRSSAKPCLVTPREFRPIKTVLFVFDGSHSCEEALAFLGDSAVFTDLDLHVVAIEKSEREVAATSLLEYANKSLTASGFTPTISVLHGETEAQLAKYSEQHHIDMMLLGSYGHNRIREFLMGNTTAKMLRHTQVPILVFH